MGVDVTASAIYGIPFGQSFPIPYPEIGDDDQEWEEDGWNEVAFLRYKGREPKDYHEVYEFMNELGIGIHSAGSDEDRFYYLEISPAGASVGWDDANDITPLARPFTEEVMDAMLKEFCEKMNIKFIQPNWYVTCLIW